MEPPFQRHCPRITDHDLHIAPVIYIDSSLSGSRHIGTDLDANYLSQLADRITQVRKASARATPHIECTASLRQLQQLDSLLA